jgi:hypothetical protein
VFFITLCYISTSLSNVRFVACVTLQLVYTTFIVVLVGGVVVIIVSSVLSRLLCYFVCATVCYMNVGVFEQVGYPTDHWVMECKGGPFLSLFPGFPVRLSLYMSA